MIKEEIQAEALELLNKIKNWREDDTAGVEAAAKVFNEEIEPFLKSLAESS